MADEVADQVADMKVDKVANMKVDMVADMKVDKVADMKVFLYFSVGFLFLGITIHRLMHYPITASLRCSHGLSASKARKTKSSRPEGPPARSPAWRAQRLLVATNDLF